MNGALIPKTPIAVDFWQLRRCHGAQVFFLSHLHGDHIQGLTASWPYPIYCSPLTKLLLLNKIKIAPELIRPLEVNESHIVSLGDGNQETMTVTVIDANHCPGSVMYLFEGYFGTILYTGDFRYDLSMFTDTPLGEICRSKSIDVCYLDNTYCNPKCYFPTRDESEEAVMKVIRQHPDHDVVIGVRTLGKESLLVKIAEEFKTWIVVSPHQYEVLKILELPNVFTTTADEGFIRTAPFFHVNNKNVEKWNKTRDTVAILPTALYTGVNGEPFCNNPKVHIIPYSDHSSYQELHSFVARLAPKKIIPVVRGSSRGIFGSSIADRAKMCCFDKYLALSPLKSFSVPESIKNYIISESASVETCARPQKRKKQWRPLFPQKRKKSLGVDFGDDSVNNISGEGHLESESEDPKSLEKSEGTNDSLKVGITTQSKERRDKSEAISDTTGKRFCFKRAALRTEQDHAQNNIKQSKLMVNGSDRIVKSNCEKPGQPSSPLRKTSSPQEQDKDHISDDKELGSKQDSEIFVSVTNGCDVKSSGNSIVSHAIITLSDSDSDDGQDQMVKAQDCDRVNISDEVICVGSGVTSNIASTYKNHVSSKRTDCENATNKNSLKNLKSVLPKTSTSARRLKNGHNKKKSNQVNPHRNPRTLHQGLFHSQMKNKQMTIKAFLQNNTKNHHIAISSNNLIASPSALTEQKPFTSTPKVLRLVEIDDDFCLSLSPLETDVLPLPTESPIKEISDSAGESDSLIFVAESKGNLISKKNYSVKPVNYRQQRLKLKKANSLDVTPIRKITQ